MALDEVLENATSSTSNPEIPIVWLPARRPVKAYRPLASVVVALATFSGPPPRLTVTPAKPSQSALTRPPIPEVRR